jgi:hypothetical protein
LGGGTTDIVNINGTVNIGTIGESGWPSCWAYLGSGVGGQDYTGDVEIVLDTEVYDTNSNFNVSTGRFTPTQAGKYLISASADINLWTPAAAPSYLYIRKNGSPVSPNQIFSMFVIGEADTDHGQASTTGIFDMNGTTDYISMHIFVSTDASVTISGGSGSTRLHASRIA